MGTNYYLHMGVCRECGRPEEVLHIGKSSVGWCFGLHVIPEDEINDLPDWERMWSLKDTVIKNEYGEKVPVDDMLSIIKVRHSTPWGKRQWGDAVIPGYYKSEAEFHRSNHSERGPNGLARHVVDGAHCVGHGAGTWDLITGEFS